MFKFLKHIIQLVIYPAKGWEDVSNAATKPEVLCHDGFYPLLAACAVSCLIKLIYNDIEYTFVSALQEAIITFTIYFATLFFAGYAFGTTMQKMTDKHPSENKNSVFIIYNLSILVLLNLISNLLPVELVIIDIFPLYVGFIIFKGVRYLDIAEDKISHFLFMAVSSIILFPFLLKLLFKILLPQA